MQSGCCSAHPVVRVLQISIRIVHQLCLKAEKVCSMCDKTPHASAESILRKSGVCQEV